MEVEVLLFSIQTYCMTSIFFLTEAQTPANFPTHFQGSSDPLKRVRKDFPFFSLFWKHEISVVGYVEQKALKIVKILSKFKVPSHGEEMFFVQSINLPIVWTTFRSQKYEYFGWLSTCRKRSIHSPTKIEQQQITFFSRNQPQKRHFLLKFCTYSFQNPVAS